MARRPLPRILSNGTAQIAKSRELARTAADSATDVLHPLITVTRGLRRLAAAGRRKWAATPKDRRGPLLFLVASVILIVALVPYGPLLAVIGLAFGLFAAFGSTRLAASLLYGVNPSDPLVFTGVTSVLACAALAACYLPARRAARIDPVQALRME